MPVLDFEVQKFTRVCAKSGRELQPGDVFYSYLIRDGGNTVRHDIAAESWESPPEDCLGWWKSEVPDPKSKKLHWAPHDVMLHYFSDAEDDPDKADLRYILALLMIRRRIFRLEETETHNQKKQVMVLYCPRNQTQYEVPVVEVDPDRAVEVQAIISQLLVDVGSS